MGGGQGRKEREKKEKRVICEKQENRKRKTENKYI